MSKKFELPKCPPYVEILGTPWRIEVVAYSKDPYYKNNEADGYCSSPDRRISILDPNTSPAYKEFSNEQKLGVYRGTLRHEIVHAFLFESGLGADSLTYRGSWAINEEMVDWIAHQGGKIYKAWMETQCLDTNMNPERYLAWKGCESK